MSFFEMEFCFVAQTKLEIVILLPYLSESWDTGMCYHAWLEIF